MKLSELQLGMMVTRESWAGLVDEVVFVCPELVVLKDKNGRHEVSDTPQGWREVKPSKKPSQRLTELMNEMNGATNYNAACFGAISRYLDEQAEKAPR